MPSIRLNVPSSLTIGTFPPFGLRKVIPHARCAVASARPSREGVASGVSGRRVPVAKKDVSHGATETGTGLIDSMYEPY